MLETLCYGAAYPDTKAFDQIGNYVTCTVIDAREMTLALWQSIEMI